MPSAHTVLSLAELWIDTNFATKAYDAFTWLQGTKSASAAGHAAVPDEYFTDKHRGKGIESRSGRSLVSALATRAPRSAKSTNFVKANDKAAQQLAQANKKAADKLEKESTQQQAHIEQNAADLKALRTERSSSSG